jgi:hypothetical protein
MMRDGSEVRALPCEPYPMPSPQRGELAGDVQAGLAEDGVGSAKLSIGDRSLHHGRARRDHEQLVIGDRVTRDSASMCAPR